MANKKPVKKIKYLEPDMKFSVGLQKYEPEVKLDKLIRKNNQMAKNRKVKSKKKKQVKVFFCPKCKSTKVGFILGWKNLFGILPRMRCKKCGLEERAFPILSVDVDKLNKLDRKNKKSTRRKRK